MQRGFLSLGLVTERHYTYAVSDRLRLHMESPDTGRIITCDVNIHSISKVMKMSSQPNIDFMVSRVWFLIWTGDLEVLYL